MSINSPIAAYRSLDLSNREIPEPIANAIIDWIEVKIERAASVGLTEIDYFPDTPKVAKLICDKFTRSNYVVTNIGPDEEHLVISWKGVVIT